MVISGAWTDLAKNNPIKQFKNTLKDKKFLAKFKKNIIGQKVIGVERRAKNILIHLSDDMTILIHLKMTGHLLFGKYLFDKKENKWAPDKKEKQSLHDPYNRFIHFVISFSNGKQLAMSDSRKFGKITLLPTKEIKNFLDKDLGPEPLEKGFTFQKFKEQLLSGKTHSTGSGRVKTILMDQKIIAGIGNIYSDEMFWLADIHPESQPKNIPEIYLKNLYLAMKTVLKKGIDFGGDSMSDYRNIYGERGDFQHHHNVYQKKNEMCGKKNCQGMITRKVIGGRSAHFCNKHQILF